MTLQGERTAHRFAGIRTRIALWMLASAIGALVCASAASAGTYPMYQCSATHPAVAPGWSVYGNQTNASTVLTNTCSTLGTIGDYVFSHGETGAVEEDGSEGSQVGLALAVPQSAPDVSIASISAQVLVSQVSGDDAFLGFASEGQGLPGAAEIHDGGSGYSANDSWTLPSGARNFDSYVNCTTDHSSTNCHFAESTHVPALDDLTLTLVDNTAPTLSGTTGTLVSAAAHGATVSGSQTLGFTGKDADSGVLSATLTLTPQGAGSTYTRSSNFSAQCTYESWNACALTQNVSPFAVPTATLKDGTYAVALSLSDAAGNITSESLGTISTDNAPKVTAAPSVSGTPASGQSLTSTAATVTSEPEAGALSISRQWQRCDSAGNNCVAIAGATGGAYNLQSADEGHMLRYQETVSNSDGSVVTESAVFGPITESKEAREAREAREAKEVKEAQEAKGANGSNGSNGSNDSSSSSGGSGVTINLPGSGSNQGTVLLGSSVKWRVSLRVAPRRVRRRTRVRLSGSVSTSPRPGTGKLVYLQARNVSHAWRGRGRARRRVTVYGKWITFQAFRAKSDGSFSSTYTFKLGGRHTYQFQAVAPAEGQYRNPTGNSSTITVKEI